MALDPRGLRKNTTFARKQKAHPLVEIAFLRRDSGFHLTNPIEHGAARMPRHRYMAAETLTASIKAELVFREAAEWPALAHRALRCAR